MSTGLAPKSIEPSTRSRNADPATPTRIPIAMIRAEEARVLFGFWRGQRLRGLEPKLKPGGKYEMATMTFREGDRVDPDAVVRLVQAAVELNATLGDPGAITR